MACPLASLVLGISTEPSDSAFPESDCRGAGCYINRLGVRVEDRIKKPDRWTRLTVCVLVS